MAKYNKIYDENFNVIGVQEVGQGGGATEIVKVTVDFDENNRYPTITSSEYAKLEAATSSQIMVFEYNGNSSYMSQRVGFVARKSDGYYLQMSGVGEQKLHVVN